MTTIAGTGSTKSITVVSSDRSGVRVDVDGNRRLMAWEELRAAAWQDDAMLSNVYRRVLEIATSIQSDAWYALVTFGTPRIDRDTPVVGQGPSAREALTRLAQEVIGTGTCSCVRVVRCETEEQARGADISDPYTVVWTT